MLFGCYSVSGRVAIVPLKIRPAPPASTPPPRRPGSVACSRRPPLSKKKPSSEKQKPYRRGYWSLAGRRERAKAHREKGGH